jgi:DNA-binding NarL/FixJ family response regulator
VAGVPVARTEHAPAVAKEELDSPVLVGRQAELAVIESVIGGSGGTSGNAGPWVAVVEGPAGIGKSSLLRSATRRAADRGIRVLTGRAGEFERAVPFGPLLDVMDVITDPNHADDAEHGRLAGPEDSGDGPVPSGVQQHRLYRRFREAVTALSRECPVLLVLEDLHWADDASLGLLEFLLHHVPAGPISLVLSYRSGQCPRRLQHALAAAPVPPVRLRIPPLDPHDVDLLLPRLPPAHRRLVARVGAGNPLYLLLLAEMPARAVSDLDRRAPVLDEHAARALDHTIRAELGGLPDAERLVAQATAVGGAQVGADLVAVIAELSEDEVIDPLDRLTARGVLTARAGRFGFSHPLLRAAAYRLAGEAWRIAAHRRAAAYLAQVGAPLMLRAQHLEHSLRPGDTQAADQLIEAARIALASAPATSAHWLSLALEILPQHFDAADPPDRERETRIRLLLGRALLASGELERAALVLRTLLDGADGFQAEALTLLAQAERILGRSRTAYGLLASAARTRARTSGPVIVELATLDLMDGRISAGIRQAHQLAHCDDRHDPVIAAAGAILQTLGDVGRGDVAASFSGLAAADAQLDALSDEQLCGILGAALPAMAWAAYLTERHELALHHLDRGIRVARKHGLSYALPHLYAAQACTLTRLGRPTEAIEAAQEGEETARAFGASDMLALAGSVKLRSMLWISGPDDIDEHWAAAQRLPEPASEWFRLSFATIMLDVGLQLDGVLPQDPAAWLGLDHPSQHDPMLATRWALAALTALRRGAVDEAIRDAETAVKVGGAWNLPGQLATARLARAGIAAATGDVTSALDDALAAADLFGAAGMPVYQGQAQLAAADAAGLTGHADVAHEQIAGARKLFAEAGAVWLDDSARRAQRRLAARQPRRAAADPALSARELQVADLVAQGLTNRAIGERLFLSPRTVESHLARIFVKLDVSSRAGVARRLPDGESSADR